MLAAMTFILGAAPVPETTAVQASVMGFFGALQAKDRVRFEAVTLPDASFISLRHTPEGWMRTRRDRDALMAQLLGVQGTIVEHFLAPPRILVDGPIATVWGDYGFSIDGKRQHCGIDVFDLVKDGDAWRIANARWTIEPHGCVP